MEVGTVGTVCVCLKHDQPCTFTRLSEMRDL